MGEENKTQIGVPNLDLVTKEELYFVLLWMVKQEFHEAPYREGYLWDQCLYAHENADSILTIVFGWDGSKKQLDEEIARVGKILIEQGKYRWI